MQLHHSRRRDKNSPCVSDAFVAVNTIWSLLTRLELYTYCWFEMAQRQQLFMMNQHPSTSGNTATSWQRQLLQTARLTVSTAVALHLSWTNIVEPASCQALTLPSGLAMHFPAPLSHFFFFFFWAFLGLERHCLLSTEALRGKGCSDRIPWGIAALSTGPPIFFSSWRVNIFLYLGLPVPCSVIQEYTDLPWKTRQVTVSSGTEMEFPLRKLSAFRRLLWLYYFFYWTRRIGWFCIGVLALFRMSKHQFIKRTRIFESVLMMIWSGQ